MTDRRQKATLRICPKCGSPACDEHATGGVTPTDTATPDDIQMELAAMRAVGTAIGELRDQDARLRILRWAIERFHPDLAVAPKSTPVPHSASADLNLSVENLDGLFENDAPVVIDPRLVENLDGLFENDTPGVNIGPRLLENLGGLFENDAPGANIGPRSLENLGGLFENDAPVVNIGPRSVENLGGLFENDAPVVNIGPRSVENLGGLFENDAPVVNIGPRSGQSEPEPELGSLVQDFVADFRQFASEWQSA